MSKKHLLLIVFLFALPLTLGACIVEAGGFIISFGTPRPVEATLTPTATLTPIPTATPAPTATPTPVPTPTTCVSPLELGLWNGNVLLNSVASRSGFRVIRQEAEIVLSLEIGCGGSVVGTASRTGQATISVPLTVNGVCTDISQYDVSGVVTGNRAQPTFDLNFLTRQGTLTCDVESRLESLPAGEQAIDLSGQVIRTRVTASSAGPDFVEGEEWPDRLYQENLDQLEELIEDADLEVINTAVWRLERQGP